MIKVCTCLFFMITSLSVSAQPGFALVWDKDTTISESNIVENTMQLWGFVDLLGVVAINQEDLDVIMTRCGAYIIELYVSIRLFALHKTVSSTTMQECIDIFKNCCAALAYIEEHHYKRCGLFCSILRDMHARMSNIPIHSQG